MGPNDLKAHQHWGFYIHSYISYTFYLYIPHFFRVCIFRAINRWRRLELLCESSSNRAWCAQNTPLRIYLRRPFFFPLHIRSVHGDDVRNKSICTHLSIYHILIFYILKVLARKELLKIHFTGIYGTRF